MKKIGIFMADGCEEIEGLTVVDVLRRAGAEVEMVSVMDRKEITGAHGIKVEADRMIEEAGEADLYVLPGGMPGTLHLKEHAGLCRLLNQAEKKEKHIAAICAAPSVLGELGMLKGKRACCYPSFEEKLNCLEVSYEPVVTDGRITYESARLDGASSFQIVTRITIPMITPTTFFVFLMELIYSFKIFREVFALFGNYPNANVYFLQNFINNNYYTDDIQFVIVTVEELHA